MLKSLFLTLALILAATISIFPQQALGRLEAVPNLGEIRGVATIRDEKATYVAVWYWGRFREPANSLLVVYNSAPDGYRELFRTQIKDVDVWEQLRSLPSGRLVGFIIETSETITEHDGDVMVAMVDGKFQIVFQGATSEFVDLDGDGYPEILESEWPDGDGYPTTTKVCVWNGKKYILIGAVPWRSRYGRRVLQLIGKKHFR